MFVSVMKRFGIMRACFILQEVGKKQKPFLQYKCDLWKKKANRQFIQQLLLKIFTGLKQYFAKLLFNINKFVMFL